METNNPETPQTPITPPNPEMPQPLNTSVPTQAPTEMPMGVPMQPVGGAPPNEGLPAQLPNTAESNKSSGGSKKMIMIAVIIIILLAIAGAAGYYFYTTQMTKDNTDSQESTSNSQLTNLQTELQTIEVADPDGEMAEIDKSISLLEATPSSGSASPIK